MLPKSERLTKKDFIGARPQMVFRGTYFDAAIIRNNMPKFGCVISKKRIKRAVDRNKAKRKIYACIQSLKPTTTNSFIIYPKQTTLNSKVFNILEELKKTFDILQ